MADKVGKKTGEKTKAGRDVYLTPDGERVSEKSVTIKFGENAFVNAPSIHDGVRYTEDEVRDMLLEGKIKPTSRHDTMEEAIKAAESRSDNLMNRGGMPKQMEMFEDGGLMDEGGTKDPVSGNDVPVGSLQEEVRDDVPAQLSEGEFVMPADVVRFHGLDKMMSLRDEAKMGLARMEAMGQMGNAEEASIPDGIPFGLEDLDIAEEPMEMQVGGFVPGVSQTPQQPPYGVVQQPFAPFGPNTYTVPSQFQQPIFAPFQQPVAAPAAAPVTPVFGPGQPTDEPKETFTFSEMQPVVGGTSETREYRNEDGEVMYIPFINGEPIYPIPAGYTPYVPEEPDPADIDPESVVGESRERVLSQEELRDRDDEDARREAERTNFNFGGTESELMKGTVVGNYRAKITYQGLTYGEARGRAVAGFKQLTDFKQNRTPELPKGATASITNIRPPGKDADGRDARVIRASVQMDSNFFNKNIANTNVSKRENLARTLDWIRKNYEREFLADKDNVINAELAFRTMQQDEKNAETAKQVRAGNFGSQDNRSPTGYTRGSVIDRAIQDAQQMVQDDDDETFFDVSVSQADLEAARQSAPTLSQAQASDDNTASTSSSSRDFSSQATGDRTSGRVGFADGGLAAKKKPKAKKMKRGGLASKK